MASFFQPAVYDPHFSSDTANGRSSSTRFLVYTNSILPTDKLFGAWYQYIVFGLGAFFFCVPLIRWIFRWILGELRSRRKSRRARRSSPDCKATSSLPRSAGQVQARPIFKQPIKSYGLFLYGDIVRFLDTEYDLHIVEFGTCTAGLPGQKLASEGHSDHRTNSANVWGLIGGLDWNAIMSLEPTLQHSVETLKQIAFAQGLLGLVISSTIDTNSRILDILDLLVRSGVPCILLDDASDPIKGVDPSVLSGIIYKNAAILSNGNRRDFFQAANLRRNLGRYDIQRAKNKTFFVGFLDRWTNRPPPAVIRRAHKFAQFHGAILLHAAEDDRDWNGGSYGNSLSAFDWIKRQEIVQAQKAWMNTMVPPGLFIKPTEADLLVPDLVKLLPGILSAFSLTPVNNSDLTSQLDEYRAPDYLPHAPPREDFWAFSSQGKPLCEFGCYDLCEDVFYEQYISIVQTQTHLERLEMLQPLATELRQKLCGLLLSTEMPNAPLRSMVDQLADGLHSGTIKVFRGLDTGFRLPDGRGHFWGVSHADEETGLSIYISLKAPDLTSTLIHTYLAHCGVPRRARFEIELILLEAESAGPVFHPRLSSELKSASPSELLFLVEQIMICGENDALLQAVRAECEMQLIHETTKTSWNKLHSHGLLSRTSTMEQILNARLESFVKNGCYQVPRASNLAALFRTIDTAIQKALFVNAEDQLMVLSQPLFTENSMAFSHTVDIYRLMVFSSLRRHAYEEIYIETTDRCPLFLQQHDQAAVFAELWVLGSQCEIYFGIRPRALGAIIYDQYREYLTRHPPPPESWNGTDVFTAYQKSKGSEEQEAVAGLNLPSKPTTSLPLRARLAKASYLTIFCVPAILDVCLLTFLGRGMYLTAFMTLEERVMANYAVLSALILTAGVTGWAGSTGGFYLYQSAYHNMNHFMVQRISGGFVLTTLLSLFGFIAFGFEYSWYAGAIFVAYLMMLGTFLNILGVMSTMHRDGAPFKSGRLVIGRCMCILLISPIVTSFFNGHDVIVYLIVLYIFLGVLIFSYSKLCREWSSWTEKIYLVKEDEILAWYRNKATASVADVVEKITTLAEPATPQPVIAAACLMEAITRFTSTKRRSGEVDSFVEKLANGHKYVVWLLEKESNGQPLPPPYSSTWIVQTKLALTNQQQINRGLKQHSPFLLYRTAKYDLAQNVGLFLVALLDRWIAVSMSANGYVVNMYYNLRARYGIAFGLLYFLLCAVSLDVVLQRYWGKTGRNSEEKLGNILEFEATESSEARIEKKRWLTAISELVFVMWFIFGFMTLLVWLMVSDYNQIILYFAYIIGYSGVIIFQFNRVFTTDIKIHVQIVFIAAFVGYCLGVALHEFPSTRQFRFNDVIALCVASISAAMGTWLFTDFCDDPSQEVHIANEDMVNWKVYSQKLLGREESGCGIKPDRLKNLHGKECFFSDPSKISEGIRAIFEQSLNRSLAPIHATFPRSREMLNFTLQSWAQQKLRLILIDRSALIAAGGGEVFAASTWEEDSLIVYVGTPAMDASKIKSEGAYERLLMQISAEAMLHETCEALLHLSHSDATLSELLLNGDALVSTRMAVQLAWSERSELTTIISRTNVELLRHLALGIDPDLDWVDLPEEVRVAILSRIHGQRYSKNSTLKDWLSGQSENVHSHDWYIKQCLGIRGAAISILEQQGDTSQYEHIWTPQKHVWNAAQISAVSCSRFSFQSLFQHLYALFVDFIEFVAIVTTGGTDCGRELWYVLRHNTIRVLALWFILQMWKICSWIKDVWIRAILLSLNPQYKEFHDLTLHGAPRTLHKGILSVPGVAGDKTGFLVKRDGGFAMVIYDGIHTVAPSKALSYQVASYDSRARLTKLIQARNGRDGTEDVRTYHYSSDSVEKLPVSRKDRSGGEDLPVHYDKYGRITHGTCRKGKMVFQFKYDFKAVPKGSHVLLCATYTSVGVSPEVVYAVYWCREVESSTDDVQTFIPSGTTQRLKITTERSAEEISWTFDHKRDPTIVRRVFRRQSSDPPQVDTMRQVADEWGILAKPIIVSFIDEDLLYYHSKSTVFKMASHSNSQPGVTVSILKTKAKKQQKQSSKWSSRDVKHVPRRLLSTATIRTTLWQRWGQRTDMDAITACMLDELMLRKEPTLKKYWSMRDSGNFRGAKAYLNKNLDHIVSNIEISHEVSQKSNLAIKTSDLFVMGLSKDSNFVINKPEEAYIDTDDRVAVIFTDTGCWPDAPGGVSNCRRDLVDGHKTVRNYALTESANEYGIPRFQVEKNLQMVKNMPLWGLDGKSPYHGLFENLLQMQVESRVRRTREKEDIEGIFVPLLKTIIRGARTRRFSKKDLFEYTNTFLNINKYFENNDYLKTWRSKAVRQAWREGWLCEFADDNISNPNDSFQIERPTAKDFDEALELYVSYFFIFSVRVPEKVPRVFQSTHHGISSLFGMILKLRRGTTWGIWDHAIMWRESCLNISPAQCILPIAVQTMLLGAMKLAANLAYLHADVILPCTAVYNPTWEAEIGTDEGHRTNQSRFFRKIDPITNGISNMDSFNPIETIRTSQPTVIMLSNVQFIKDVKTAIVAAGVIVNDFGFKNYNLVVYGAQDRQPSYAIETEELIVNLGIGKTVKLGGFGSPKDVLKDAWLFMNSSLSEGLPLAIGEAALSGVPIVATEVGATAQVLTDVDDPSILYGEVVPPNDPVALARAQISLLAMVGPWARYTTDDKPPPLLPTTFTPADVEWLSARMHAKTADRRKLGLKLRDVVLRKFNGLRYLREHEQMYWVQRHMASQRMDPKLMGIGMSHPKLGDHVAPDLIEGEDCGSMWNEPSWQDFGEKPAKSKDASLKRKTIVDYGFRVYSHETVRDLEIGDQIRKG